MREKIISLGGEFYFNTLCTDFIIDSNTIKGVTVKNLATGESQNIASDAVLLATGHSATDIYRAHFPAECVKKLHLHRFL